MKNIIISVFISFFIAIFSYLSYNSNHNLNFIKNIGNYIDDKIIFGTEAPYHDDDVIILKIDDKTFDELGRSDLGMANFDKGFYGDIIKNLFENYNVSVIGIDVILANRSNLGKADEIKLKTILDKYGENVVLAARSDYTPHNLCMYNNTKHGIIELIAEERVRSMKIYYPEYDASLKCHNSDFKTIEENKNGIYNFPIEISKKYINNIENLSRQDRLKNSLEKNIKIQKKKNNGALNISFYLNKKKNNGTIGFKSYSLIDIYNNKDIDLKGKIILIGEVGTLIHDSHFTPISTNERMPGVEIHANAVTTILNEGYLTTINKYIIITYIFILNLFTIYIVFKFKTSTNLIIIGTIIFLNISIAKNFYTDLKLIFSVFSILYSVVLLTFILSYIYKYTVTDKSKRHIKKAFSMYVSKDVVDEIAKDPSKLNLTGENKNMSIFFSDIVGFTSISESMSASDLFYFLNEYLDEMTKILNKNKGTLDKYIGDAVMGFFNAPLDLADHEYLSCLTAVEQQKKLIELNKKWKEKGLPKIAIRIGIHTGEAMHGNLGSMGERINYTVIGDSVNLAARLEGICKYYGVDITISEHTNEKIKDKFVTRELDRIAVKGKEEPITIFELIGLKSDKSSLIEKYKYIKIYEKGLKAYYSGEYEYAIKLLSNNRNDLPSQLLKARCKEVISGKVKIKNGVFTMTQK